METEDMTDQHRTEPAGGRHPQDIIRAAAKAWFDARMAAMSNYEEEAVRLHLRTQAAVAHRTTAWPRNEPFRRHIMGVLIYAPKLTIDEQRAVEQYLTDHGQEAAITIQLALG